MADGPDALPTDPSAADGPDASCGDRDYRDSPCVAVCSTLYDEICRGCGRTVMEVANWVFFSEAEKRRVWERITAQGYPRRKG